MPSRGFSEHPLLQKIAATGTFFRGFGVAGEVTNHRLGADALIENLLRERRVDGGVLQDAQDGNKRRKTRRAFELRDLFFGRHALKEVGDAGFGGCGGIFMELRGLRESGGCDEKREQDSSSFQDRPLRAKAALDAALRHAS